MPSLLTQVLRRLLSRAAAPTHTSTTSSRGVPGGAERSRGPGAAPAYPGDFRGIPDLRYAARADGRPDTGEVVWTWVPYEEDFSQGKDRPVLLVGRDGEWLLGLALTSKDHDRDAGQESRAGRQWIDVGTGPWDRKGRPSEVRINRIIRVRENAIRREGGILPRDRFEQVAAAVRSVKR